MKFRLFQVALLFMSLLYAGCCTCPPQQADAQPVEQKQDEQQQAQDQRPSTDSDILPVGNSPILGDASAPVTVVAFSDLQCPFCQRGAETMHQLQQKYPNEVRVVFKHYPLPFHQQADEAAKAAIAAGNQGKFWEMHDWLFDNYKQYKSHANDMKEWTAGYAKRLGLDVAQFEEDFDARATQQVIDEDMALGQEVEVKGTPHFFVNGERVQGAQPLAAFEAIVKEQINEAKQMQQDGVAKDAIYAKMVAENYGKTPERDQRRRQKPTTKVEYVPVDASEPMFGNAKDPVVTIVEFSDFQCPFCARVTPTVKKIAEEYPDQVRIVFKQLPLFVHAQAKPAAKAALAAHEQGKFWEMHDKLFENQREMRNHAEDFKEWSAGLAKELGMNTDKFKKDFHSDAIAKKIERDIELSEKIGARGTPNFWINGVNVRGARPYASFKKLIDEQIAVAEQLEEDKGLSGDALYKAVVETNQQSMPGAEAREPSRAQEPDPKVDLAKLEIGGAPFKGPKNAPVTVVAFSDFQCPYCSRGEDNLFAAMKKYPGEVRVVFKHYPLPFHKEAKPAAKAAMAAGEQGKFWEMHDLLFENQRRLREEGIFVELAKELGLNLSKFNKDMQNPEYDKIIDEDMKQGQAAGVRGTPAFFINGTRVVGAQPTSKFEGVIEEALEETQ